MNYEQILETLKEKLSVEDFAFEDYNDQELGLGPIKEVYQKGGEGEGDHWESVKHFSDYNVYISVIGFYASHHGTDFYDGWECCKEVKPQQKTITVYE